MSTECIKKSQRTEYYADKTILAPMVRANSLPFRLLCLRYGADIVYSEELIDYRVCTCQRLENKVLGTIDFIDDRGEVIFRTCDEEKDKLVFQLGSNDPDRAIRAAKLICNDVTGIDFNFGCPKTFSISGGMGAAMLEKPLEIKALLSRCVNELDNPITCKIRLLPKLEDTIELVKLIESCGVSAIAVHGRTKDQRSSTENQDDVIRRIVESVSIPVIANGGSNGMKSYSDVLKFKDKTKASSVMIARAAMRDPSIFKSDNNRETIKMIVTEFLKLAVIYDNYATLTKYSMQAMMSSSHFGGDFVQSVHKAVDHKALCDLFDLSQWYEEHKIKVDRSEFYDKKTLADSSDLEDFLNDKQKFLAKEGLELLCDNIPFNRKSYGDSTPKSKLIDYLNKSKDSDQKLDIETFQLGQKHRYYCSIKLRKVCYINKSSSNSKKLAEQATALIVCNQLGLVDLSDYKNRMNGSRKKVN